MAIAPVAAEPYFVRTETTGGIHLRYRLGGRTVDDGRCGIDDNWVEVDDAIVAETDHARLCGFCFPDGSI
jgi:hypothetical protein